MARLDEFVLKVDRFGHAPCMFISLRNGLCNYNLARMSSLRAKVYFGAWQHACLKQCGIREKCDWEILGVGVTTA